MKIPIHDPRNSRQAGPADARAHRRARLTAAFCACAGYDNPSSGEKQLIVQNRDVDQASSQANSTLCRKVFVRPNHLLDYSPNFSFKDIYPTNGLPKSPIHWFTMNHSHLKQKLIMLPSDYNACFTYTPKCLSCSLQSSNAPMGMVSRRMTVPTPITRDSRISKNA